MVLADELKKLHALQDVDTQIYQREQALKALDSGEGLKRTAIDLLKRHDAAEAALRKAEAAQKDRELELKSTEKKRADVDEKLYSGRVNNPKELGDLQHEEELLDKHIGELEEIVLGLMDETERAKTVETTLAGELAAAKRRWQQMVAHTKAETERLQKEIAALRPERARLATLVEKSLLLRYDEIRQERSGVGMVAVTSETCPGCHIKLNSKVYGRLREGDELTQCENCDRILAWGI
ncbi:MAG: zinc ribbon domain-containing protein [Armatimonadota bacterium]